MLNRLKDKDESFFRSHMSEYLKMSQDCDNENNNDNSDGDSDIEEINVTTDMVLL